ncbi:EAL domain-containing protein [Agrilutibacter solisilvae]|uniref:EAL domain-containing protein n=1 Tax=Agrilutibacter solisilvae TaxID=2763317 RepID=A0A974Y2C5_9GAMM|nr:EAL domain-containing protein [Lysobacter solisilvae]QSX79310.1 EAL domain-containing protein [Lysobacter solisilvae]
MKIPSPLRVLLVEDSRADADLVLHSLARMGIPIEHRRVADEPQLRSALDSFLPHVILSDFTMPGFSGHHALALASELAPRVPFVFVSNTIGEDVAIEALRLGADDYVLKDNLRRLPPAVERALRSAEERRSRERMEGALRESEERFRSIVESSEDWIWEMDASRHVSYSNPAVQPILGFTPEQMLGRSCTSLLFEDGTGEAYQPGEAPWQGLRLRFRHADGGYRVLESTGGPRYGADGELLGFRGINRDITAYLAQESRIRHLARLHAVLSALGNAVLRAGTRQGVLDAACRVAVEQGGFLAACIREVDSQGHLMMVAGAGDAAALETTSTVGHATQREPDPALRGPSRRALDETRATIVSNVARDRVVPDWAREPLRESGIGAMAVLPIGRPAWGALGLYAAEPQTFGPEEAALFERLVDEIDFAVEFIAKSEQLAYLAYHNPVSGLPNRAAFQARLRARLRQGPTVFVLADIDLAAVNESRGRAFGDALLRQVGQRLYDRIGEAGLVAHLEAGAFAIAYPAAGPAEAEGERVERLLQDIHHEAFQIGGEEIRISLRAGHALAAGLADDPEVLEHNAAAALIEAKRRRQRVYAFNDELRGRAARRLRLEHELRAAVEAEEFELHYQPKFSAASQSLIGAEALLRWRHPTRGLVSPGEFMQVLEDSGLIVHAGRWAMAQALRTALAWRERHPGFRIAVNVSAQELRSTSFLDDCRALLQPHAMDQPLDVEITESVLVDDIEHSMHVLDALRDLGCRVSIDDFGTGYSSLNYLARLPSDEIKIDRSFIALITESPETLALVTNIIGLAHSLSLKVVAEGVEEHEQAKLLRLLRCDVLQGYLLGKPMSAEDFDRRLFLGQPLQAAEG